VTTQKNTPDPGSGGEDEHLAGVADPSDLEPAADDADEVAGVEVAEARRGGTGEALDEKDGVGAEGRNWPAVTWETRRGAWEERSREMWKSEASGVETSASVQSVGAGSGAASAAAALEMTWRCYGRRRWWSRSAGNRRSIRRPAGEEGGGCRILQREEGWPKGGRKRWLGLGWARSRGESGISVGGYGLGWARHSPDDINSVFFHCWIRDWVDGLSGVIRG
jgi:hypothetical protein